MRNTVFSCGINFGIFFLSDKLVMVSFVLVGLLPSELLDSTIFSFERMFECLFK